MILERVLDLYNTDPALIKRRQPGKGNPTASQAGNCAAQLQMLRFPAISHPEPASIRIAWAREDGDMHEKDLSGKVERALPKMMSGLKQELFYFPVPVTPEQERALVVKIADRSLWGTVIAGFKPPHVTAGPLDETTGKYRDTVRFAPRSQKVGEESKPAPLGFVLDPGTGVLWVPLYIDHMIRVPDPDYPGITVVEYKAYSEFGFQRASLGQMDYSARVQLAVIAAATGMDVLWIIKRKNTAHTLEIGFKRGIDRVRVHRLLSNGQQETFFVAPDGTFVNPEGKTVEPVGESEWDAAQIWTPYDDSLLDEARARILRVLLFDANRVDPAALPFAWYREYGPSFSCKDCVAGRQQCGYCKGTGISTRSKPPGKTCGAKNCEGRGWVPCEKCDGKGNLEAATLQFPCTYCSVMAHCWDRAKPTLSFKGRRPAWTIQRADFEASGLQFFPREPAPVEEVTADA